jgi:hypothetical protein
MNLRVFFLALAAASIVSGATPARADLGAELHATALPDGWAEGQAVSPNLYLALSPGLSQKDESFVSVQRHEVTGKVLDLKHKLALGAVNVGDLFGELRVKAVQAVPGGYELVLADELNGGEIVQSWFFGAHSAAALTRSGPRARALDSTLVPKIRKELR